MVITLKALRKLRMAFMAKNLPKRGKSARNGNKPAPYTKYKKSPHKYSTAYYEWNRAKKSGKPTPKEGWKAENRTEVRQFRMAAE